MRPMFLLHTTSSTRCAPRVLATHYSKQTLRTSCSCYTLLKGHTAHLVFLLNTSPSTHCAPRVLATHYSQHTLRSSCSCKTLFPAHAAHLVFLQHTTPSTRCAPRDLAKHFFQHMLRTSCFCYTLLQAHAAHLLFLLHTIPAHAAHLVFLLHSSPSTCCVPRVFVLLHTTPSPRCAPRVLATHSLPAHNVYLVFLQTLFLFLLLLAKHYFKHTLCASCSCYTLFPTHGARLVFLQSSISNTRCESRVLVTHYFYKSCALGVLALQFFLHSTLPPNQADLISYPLHTYSAYLVLATHSASTHPAHSNHIFFFGTKYLSSLNICETSLILRHSLIGYSNIVVAEFLLRYQPNNHTLLLTRNI